MVCRHVLDGVYLVDRGDSGGWREREREREREKEN